MCFLTVAFDLKCKYFLFPDLVLLVSLTSSVLIVSEIRKFIQRELDRRRRRANEDESYFFV